MKKCINCHADLEEHAKFCTVCGTEQTAVIQNLSSRKAVNGVIWILIAVCQLSYVFLEKSGFWLFLLGAINLFSGIGMLNSKNKLSEDPRGIVFEHKIEPDMLWEYAWNGIIALLALAGEDYLLAVLAVLAIAVDFFLVKLYVAVHKQEFFALEEAKIRKEETEHVLYKVRK